MELLKNYLIRKFIPFIALVGSLTAFFTATLYTTNRNIDVVKQASLVIGVIGVGILVGVLASVIFEKANKELLTFDYKGKASVFKQKIYFITPIMMLIGYYIGSFTSKEYAIVCAIVYGFVFINGLAAGIFDYKEVVSKNLLYVGVVPIGVSFAYAYYFSENSIFIDIVWIFGSVYLFAYLLFINRLRLYAIIFFRNSVNVENSKSIRVANDILISGFFGLFILFFNLKNAISFVYNLIIKAVALLFDFLAKIMSSLLAFGSFEPADSVAENFNGFGDAPVEQSLLVKILIGIFGALFIIGMLVVVYWGIKFIISSIKRMVDNFSGVGNKKRKDKKIKTKEYEEESQIIKDKKNKVNVKRANKYLYTLKELNKVNSNEEKLRYLYAFAIERLIKNNIKIDKSDTPIQILDKINESKGGEILNNKQFNKFTQEYRRVRYGYKETMSLDFLKEAKKLEKLIASINTNNKKSK